MQMVGQPATDRDHPGPRQRGAEEHHQDQLAAGGVFRQVARVVRHIGCIGDVVAGRGSELSNETGPVEAQRRRFGFARGQGRQHRIGHPAHHHRQGHQTIQWQRQEQCPFETAVHPVMAENGQDGGRYGYRHGDHHRVEAEQRMQPLHHQHQVDDVEPGKHEQRCQQHQDDPAIAELRPRLNHLRQAQVWPLGAMKGHEQGAEHDAERAGQGGPQGGQADTGADETDGHGKEGEVAQEPERSLAFQFVGALVLGDEVNRMPFDCQRGITLCSAGGGLG
ncbi:hypothetical protein D9M71_426890 [compost metagenome]